MMVSVGIDESLQVIIDDEQPGYPGPDILDDMVRRARDLFRDAMADANGHRVEPVED